MDINNQSTRLNDFLDDDDDDVRNNNNNNNDFPDDDDEGDVRKVVQDAIPWKEVPQKTWLRLIYKFINIETRYGPATILELQKRDGTLLKAWTTNLIASAIAKKEEEEEAHQETNSDRRRRIYIKSMGMVESKKNKTMYFDFQLKLF